MLLGEELSDLYTQESLGRTEREIGVVEVTRVDQRVSYGRLVSGSLPPAGADVTLRPAAAAAAAAPATTRPRPASGRSSTQANGAPRLPFE